MKSVMSDEKALRAAELLRAHCAEREAARTVSSDRNLASAAGLRMHDLRSTGSYSERTEAKMQTEEMLNELST